MTNRQHCSTSFRRRARRGVAAFTTLAFGACSGPLASVDVNGKNVPLDLLLGAKRTVARAPVPPVAFDVDGKGLPRFTFEDFPAGHPARSPRTTLPPRPCVDDPLAIPEIDAPRVANPLPPRAAAYTYRVSGASKEGDKEEPLPPTATVEVLNPRGFDLLSGNLDATWDLAVTLGEATTTTSYRSRRLDTGVSQDTEADAREAGSNAYPDDDPLASSPTLRGRVPQPPEAGDAPAHPQGGLPAGLYMERIQTGAAVFEPKVGLLLARYPITIGEWFDVSGTDGATTMSYRTRVVGKAHVRACGKAVDTWTIELEEGRLADAHSGEVLGFTARYQVATQYGGLIVASHTDVNGTRLPATPLRRTIDMVTTTAPK